MDHLIRSASVVNEGKIITSDVLIKNGRIEKIDTGISVKQRVEEIHAEGLYLMPGIIDDQVHFREPGLTHKGDIFSESRASVAGGITSTMDMPNVVPPSLTQELLQQRYDLASKRSCANYSFYMGTSNDNAEEVLRTNPKNVCGIKIFLGASTGNLLVDNKNTLGYIFANAELLIATHCEDETTIKNNLEKYKQEFGENIPVEYHPLIRNEEACYKSSSYAVELAKKTGARLHILHISTEDELSLFDNSISLENKKIMTEVCVHHLYFDASDYERLGTKIKWNPAIKDRHHKAALLKGLLDDKLDVIATDHAPHTMEEKSKPYLQCPSGGPLVQHSLNVMLDFYHRENITLEKIAQKMSHDVATCFKIKERGFIREGYFADLILVDINKEYTVSAENILYKCGWSPFEEKTFKGKVMRTYVSGHPVYSDGQFNLEKCGERLLFR